MQGDLLVNIQRQMDNKEEHVMVVNCRGQKKSMRFLLGMIKPHLNRHAKFVVADGACGGLLRLIEMGYPG